MSAPTTPQQKVTNRITIVISESVSPSLLGAKACGVKNVKDISMAKSGTEDVLKKDPAAEKAPEAGAVDSDKAKAVFTAHAPRPTAVFWSKFRRPTGPPTALTGAVEGALKKDIPAAESGAEASVDETGAIKNPALKPATEVATALKPAAAGGVPLPSIKDFPEKKLAAPAGDWNDSTKDFPEETAAPAGIDEWALKPAAAGGETQPSNKEFSESAPAGDDGWTVSAKETPAPAGEPDWIVSNSRNKTERKGEVKSTKVSNKYDLLDDVETNVKAEIDEKTGKEKGAEKESSFESVSPESVSGNGKAPRGSTPSTTHSGATANPKTTTTATPKGSVSAFGWLSWPKLCWHNVLCTLFICLIAVSAGGGAYAYFSHGSDSLLPSIVVPHATALPTETERGPLFAPFNPTPEPVVPDPPNVVEDSNWLVATSGFCSNLNVVMKERDVEASETPGDRDGHFVADISFNYYPQTAVKFTDFPYHLANTIEGDQNEVDALVSSDWDHKSIALLEPTSTCSANEQNDLSWGISVFKVEEHRACSDDETAWDGHPCVHYSGYVSEATSNFVNVNEARFPCQLFVDSATNAPRSIGDPNCNNDNAPAYRSDVSDNLNVALGEYGFIFRNRFDSQTPCSWTNSQECMDDMHRTNCNNDGSACGVAATLLSNKVITPNPAYCPGCGLVVGYAVLNAWTKKGGIYMGYAYYPADANSVDKRDWEIYGTPGRGCHDAQQYLRVDGSHWVTYDSYGNSPTGAPYYCKCDYDNFDPRYFGEYIVNNGGNKQPSYQGQDFSVCWLEETDDINILFEMQNSIYMKKDEWWNGAIGRNDEPVDSDPATWQYQGWNEVAFDANIDYMDDNGCTPVEALIVVLPTGFESLCDFDYDAVQNVDKQLLEYWKDGYGHTPVVVMKTTNENGDGYTYQKETFAQSFQFESGNCIKDIAGYLYFIGDGDGC